MRKVVFVGALMWAVFGAWVGVAQADMMLSLSSGSTAVSIEDGGAGDWNPMAGAITFIGSIGTFLINVTTGLSVPAVGAEDEPALDLNSVNVSTPGTGTLTIQLSDTFSSALAPHVAGFASTIGGTLPAGGASLGYTTSLDGQGLGSGYYGPTPSGPGPSVFFGGAFFSQNVSVGTPYTLMQTITLTLPAGGSASFNANLEALPEPFSLLLVGTGLVGLGFLSRRKLQRSRR